MVLMWFIFMFQIFISWVSIMDFVFSPLLKWPSRSKINKYFPKSFRKHFPHTRAVIDCTEINIQRPRKPTPQSETYSTYKSHNTFKILLAVTPTGAFSFVSDLWGGNTSDRYLTEHSGFLDLIESGDNIMADRGFNIQDLLLRRGATLTIPSFTRKCNYGKGKRLNINEVKRSKLISKFRIHVERAIGRYKNWDIINHTMPLNIQPVANKIMRILAFLCNMKGPMLK